MLDAPLDFLLFGDVPYLPRRDLFCGLGHVVGVEEVGQPFSGKISFIKTKMYWPVNHMVSSKENTVKCIECHTRENSRLTGLTDFYMPGRDYSKLVETLGSLLLILTLLAVLIHGSLRIVTARRLKRRGIK